MLSCGAWIPYTYKHMNTRMRIFSGRQWDDVRGAYVRDDRGDGRGPERGGPPRGGGGKFSQPNELTVFIFYVDCGGLVNISCEDPVFGQISEPGLCISNEGNKKK